MEGGASTGCDVFQLTKLQSKPHKLFSRILPGKSTLPISPVQMLARREANFSGRSRFSSADSCHVLSRYLPEKGPHVIDKTDNRCYVSQFSHDGSLFVAAFEGSRIKIYDVDSGWEVRNYIQARGSRIIIDTSLSPDKRFLAYSNFSQTIHLVNIASAAMESDENITETHDAVNLVAGREFGQYAHRFYSVNFSDDGRELLSGSSDTSIYLYDLGANRFSLCLPAHKSHVNTTCFADESGQVIYSGSDDGLCKVWDRRCLYTNEQASGILVGHLDGVTFIDSRRDGRHLISNSIDQRLNDTLSLEVFKNAPISP